MKRGKIFLLYISSIVFCCLFMFVFVNKDVEAASFTYSFVKDTEKGDYYKLDKINIDESELGVDLDLEILETYNDGNNGELSVKSISSNIFSLPENATKKVSINSLVLPSNLNVINQNAFYNVEYLKELSVPTSVTSIGADLFESDASVGNIYLNHFQVTATVSLEIDKTAFTEAEKIICANHDIYTHFSTYDLNGTTNLVAKIYYTYHSSPNPSKKGTLIEDVLYYIGANQKYAAYNEENDVENELYKNHEVEGLVFDGWGIANNGNYVIIRENENVFGNAGTSRYDVYPQYSLDDATFDIIVEDDSGLDIMDVDGKYSGSIKYNAKEDLVNLSIANSTIPSGASRDSISWYKVAKEEVFISNLDSIKLKTVSQSGAYKCVIKYSRKYDEITYTNYATMVTSSSINITPALLYIKLGDVTMTYGEYLTEANIYGEFKTNGGNETNNPREDQIWYRITGLLGDDTLTINNNSFDYPNSTSAGKSAGVHYNEIRIKLDAGEIVNYDPIYSYGSYIVEKKHKEILFDDQVEFTYGDEIIVSKTIEDEVYGGVKNSIKVVFEKEYGSDVGTYNITGIKSIDNPNYIFSFSEDSTGKVVINKKEVGAKYFYIDDLVYKLNVYYDDENEIHTKEIEFVLDEAYLADIIMNEERILNNGIKISQIDVISNCITNYDGNRKNLVAKYYAPSGTIYELLYQLNYYEHIDDYRYQLESNSLNIYNDDKFKLDITLVYSDENKVFDFYYEDVKEFKIEMDYLFDEGNRESISQFGDYTLNLAALSGNYSLYEGHDVVNVMIDKAVPAPVYAQYQEYTYTGEKINPYILSTNDEQTDPDFVCKLNGQVGNQCIKGNSLYTVTATYSESDNYKQYSVDISLKINRRVVNLTPKSFKFYQGEPLKVEEEIEIDGRKVLVVYEHNADNKFVRTYNITNVTIKDITNESEHSDYKGSIIPSDNVGKIEVVKRPAKLVYYNYENLVYNGKEKNIGVYAIDVLSGQVIEGLKLIPTCDEGVIKDAKTYHLKTNFESDIYELVNSNLLETSVAKAKYDLSQIKFNNKSFVLNFKKHSIEIEGKLPDGVSVHYKIDGENGNSTSGAFSHVVVASFVGDSFNYIPIDDMQATIYIDMGWVFTTLISLVVLAGIGLCLALIYMNYRRNHPKKIKLKIRSLLAADLDEKRAAQTVEEALSDDTKKHKNKEIEEIEEEEEVVLEDENDILDDPVNDKNFIDRIYAADSELKYYYSEVKNELLSYTGVTHSVDRKFEVFYHGTRQIAKLSICNEVLKLYVNLEPSKYDKSQYNHQDMSKIDCHSRTPLRIDVNTLEGLRHAKIFIRILRRRENLKASSNFVRIDYEKFYTLKENIFPKLFKKMFVVEKNKKKK